MKTIVLFFFILFLALSGLSQADEYATITTRTGQGFEILAKDHTKSSVQRIYLPGSDRVYLHIDSRTFMNVRYSGSASNYRLLPDGSWIIGPNAAAIRIPYRYRPTSYYQKLYNKK